MSEISAMDPESFRDPLCDYEPREYESDVERALAEESVSAIQSRPFALIRPTAPIRLAVQALAGSQASCLLVVERGRVIGIFTERDVLERVAEQFDKLAAVPVSQVMTSNPTVIYETDPAGTAVAAIAIAGHRHVPVLSVDDQLQGIVGPQRVFDFLEDYF